MPRKAFTSHQTRLVLSALLGKPRRWRHGYDLSIETGLKSGTLYPLLMRLSDHGYLDARWSEPDQSGRPPRHEYKLTPSGITLAREQTASETYIARLAAQAGASL